MNKLKRTLQWVTGIVVGLYLATILLLNVPVVQRWAASGTASVLSSLLGTNVTVGRIAMGWNWRILVDDLRIEDRQGEEMIHAARVGARIGFADLLRKRIRIGNAQLFGMRALLYQERPDSALNIQFFIDALASKDTTRHTPLDLRIGQILVRRGNVRCEQRWKPFDLQFNNLNLTAQLNVLTDDSLNVKVKRFDVCEARGLCIKEMAFAAVAGKGGARLTDFHLALPNSYVNIPSLTLTTPNGNFSYTHAPRISDLTYMTMVNAQITPSDLKILWPKLADLDNTAHLSLSMDGEGENAFVRSLRIWDEKNGLQLTTSGRIRDFCQGLEQLGADVEIEQLHVATQLLSPYVNHPLLSRVGTVDATGRVFLAQQKGRGNLDIRSPLGILKIKGEGDTGKNIEANVTSEDFHLGEWLERKDLGIIAMDVNVKGKAEKGSSWLVDGKINELDYRGYRYRGIALDGTFNNKLYEGRVNIDDVNLALHAEGTVNLTQSSIKANADIDNFAPNLLNLTRKYADTRFSGNINVDLEGSSLNRMAGTVHLNDLAMTDSTGTYRPGDIHVTSRPEEDELNLQLISPFLEAQARGVFEPKVLVSQVRRMVNNYLQIATNETEAEIKSTTYGNLELRLHSAEPLNRLLGIPLTLQGTTTAHAEFDDATRAFLLKCEAPEIQYGQERMRNISLRMECNQKSLQCSAELQRLMKGKWIEFGTNTLGNEGKLLTRFYWNNHNMPTYAGDISVHSRLWKDISGRLGFEGEVLPSSIMVGDTLWSVHPGFVRYYDDMLQVDSFCISRGQRFVSLEGRASKSDTDTLHAKLQEIDLEYIFSLINFHAVELTGSATGDAYAHSLFSKPKADAYIQIPQFALNYGTLGDLDIHLNWGDRPYSIFLDGKIQDYAHQGQTLVQGYITPKKDVSYHGIDLNVKAERVNMYFINKWTANIFDDLEGRATGWVHIYGPFKMINIEGDAIVNEGSIGVPFTGVRYHLKNDSVQLRPDNIYFTNAHLYDPQGNPGIQGHSALATGHLHHDSFKDLSFDISIKGDNILGYDFQEFGDQNFYGTVYATGEVTLKGHPGLVRIGIKARPERGTTFTYNVSSPDKLTNTPFINYVSKEQKTLKNLKDPDNVEMLKELHVINDMDEESDIPSNDMYITFDLDLDDQSTMNLLMDTRSGDKITINGGGNIHANFYNKGNFQLFGTYRVSRGTYNLSLQEVIHKNFDFSEGGTITFNGEPFEGDLNLQATHTVNNVSLNDINPKANFSNSSARVNCVMNIGGKARSPQITFDFDILNANEDQKQMVRSLISTEEERNMQVIYLLGIGRFYAYDYANDDQTQGTTAMNSILSSTLSGTINQALSNMLGKTNWNFGTNLHTGEMGWSDMDVEGILQGNLLNNRLLINGNFGYRDTPVANSNFVGDFDVRYLLTRSGSVALKAYSETNDRYFTKSALTTQGIGILLKKDFTSVRDLVTKKRKRKK